MCVQEKHSIERARALSAVSGAHRDSWDMFAPTPGEKGNDWTPFVTRTPWSFCSCGAPPETRVASPAAMIVPSPLFSPRCLQLSSQTSPAPEFPVQGFPEAFLSPRAAPTRHTTTWLQDSRAHVPCQTPGQRSPGRRRVAFLSQLHISYSGSWCQ